MTIFPDPCPLWRLLLADAGDVQPRLSLFAAAAICLLVIAHDVSRGRSIKMLGARLRDPVRAHSAAISRWSIPA